MRFGLFYELQLPRPWNEGDEHRLFNEALGQIVLADRLGFDFAWEVEHHFLDEYSHSSAPEVFLAAAASVFLLTRAERILLSSPSVACGFNVNSVSATMNPKRESPKNSSLSL